MSTKSASSMGGLFSLQNGGVKVPPLLIAAIAITLLPIVIGLLTSRKENVGNIGSKAAPVICDVEHCAYREECVKTGARAVLPEGVYVCQGNSIWTDPQNKVIANLPASALQQTKRKSTTSNVPVATNIPSQLVNISTVKKVLNWISTQRNSRGAYLSGINCSVESGKCVAPIDDPRVAPQVMWARYQYYLTSGDQTELANVGKDLDALLNLYNDPNYRISYLNNFPICSMLYVVQQDPAFSAEQKQNMRSLCEKSVFIGAPVSGKVEVVGGSGGADVNVAAIGNQLPVKIVDREPDVNTVIGGGKLTYDQGVDMDDYLNGYYTYAVSASDLTTQYVWFNDSTKLSLAKEFFIKGLQIYSNDRNKILTAGKSDMILAVAAVDLYRVTKDKKYLDFASFTVSQKEQAGCSNTDDCTVYLQLLDALLQQTNDLQYKTLATQVISRIVVGAYDDTVGAFDSMSKKVRLFKVNTNSIIAGTLARYAK